MMDLSGMEELIPPIAQMLGIEPATALLGVGLIVTAANIAGRLIPDDATGALGTIRKAAKFIGLVVPNRIARGVSVDEVAKAVVTRKVTNVAETIESDAKQVLREQVTNKLPGIGRD